MNSSRLLATEEGPIELVERFSGDAGRGSFVLLHGIQGTASAWEAVADHLGPGRAVLMPNLRGRGHSLSPASIDRYTLKHFARDLDAVIAAAPPPVTLVGWSMGVLVALTWLQTRDSSKLDGLVLTSGTPYPGTEAVWFHGADEAAISREAEERAERLHLAAAATTTAVAGAWLSVRAADLRGVLPKIALPTLVIHGGEDDQCPPDHAYQLAEGVPGARLEMWRGCGHNPMAFDASRFVASLRAAGVCAATNILSTTQ